MGQNPSKHSSDEEREVSPNQERRQRQNRKQDDGSTLKSSKKDNVPSAILRSGFLAPSSPASTNDNPSLHEPLFNVQQAIYELEPFGRTNIKNKPISPSIALAVSDARVKNVDQQQQKSLAEQRAWELVQTNFKQIPKYHTLKPQSDLISNSSSRIEGGMSSSSPSLSPLRAIEKTKEKIKKKAKRRFRFGNVRLQNIHMRNIHWWRRYHHELKKKKSSVPLNPQTCEKHEFHTRPTGNLYNANKFYTYFNVHRWAARLPRIAATTNLGSGTNRRFQSRLRYKMFTEWIAPERLHVFYKKTVAPSQQHFMHPPSFYYPESSKRSSLNTPRTVPRSERTRLCRIVEPEKKVEQEIKKNLPMPYTVSSNSSTCKFTADSAEKSEESASSEEKYESDCSTSSRLSNEHLLSFIHMEEQMNSSRLNSSLETNPSIIADQDDQEAMCKESPDGVAWNWETENNLNSHYKDDSNWLLKMTYSNDSNQILPVCLQGHPSRPQKQQERMKAGKEIHIHSRSASKASGTVEKIVGDHVHQSLNYDRVNKGKPPNTNQTTQKHFMENELFPPTETNSSSEESENVELTHSETDEPTTVRDVKINEDDGTELRTQLNQEDMKTSVCEELRIPQRTWLVPIASTQSEAKSMSVFQIKVPPLLLTDIQEYDRQVESRSSEVLDLEEELVKTSRKIVSLDQSIANTNLWLENQRWLEAQQETEDIPPKTVNHSPIMENVPSSNQDLPQFPGISYCDNSIVEQRQKAGTEPSTTIVCSKDLVARLNSEKNTIGMIVTNSDDGLPRFVINSGSSEPFSTASSETSVSSMFTGRDDRKVQSQKNPLTKTLDVLKSAFQTATRWREHVSQSNRCYIGMSDSSSTSYTSTSTISEEETEEESEVSQQADESNSSDVTTSVSLSPNKPGSSSQLSVLQLQCEKINLTEKYWGSNYCKSHAHCKDHSHVAFPIPVLIAQTLLPYSQWPKVHCRPPLVCTHVARLTGTGVLVAQSAENRTTQQYSDDTSMVDPKLPATINQPTLCLKVENGAGKIPELPTSHIPEKLSEVWDTYQVSTSEKITDIQCNFTDGYTFEVSESVPTVTEETEVAEKPVCLESIQYIHDTEMHETPCSCCCNTEKTCWTHCNTRTFGRHIIPKSVLPVSFMHEHPHQVKFRSKRLEKHYNEWARSTKKTYTSKAEDSTQTRHKTLQDSPNSGSNQNYSISRLTALRWLSELRQTKDQKRAYVQKSQTQIFDFNPFHKPFSARIVAHHFFLPSPVPSAVRLRPKSSIIRPKKTVHKKRPPLFRHNSSPCFSKIKIPHGFESKFLCVKLPSATHKRFKQQLSHKYINQCSKQLQFTLQKQNSLPKQKNGIKTEKEASSEVPNKPKLESFNEADKEVQVSSNKQKRREEKDSEESEELAKEQLRGLADIVDEASSSLWNTLKRNVIKKDTAGHNSKSNPKVTQQNDACTCGASMQNASLAPTSVCICRHQECAPKSSEIQTSRRRHVIVIAKRPPLKKKLHHIRVTLGPPLAPTGSQKPKGRSIHGGHQSKPREEKRHASDKKKSNESITAGGERTIGVCVQHLTPRTSATAWKEGIGVEDLIGLHTRLRPSVCNSRPRQVLNQSDLGKNKIVSATNPDIIEPVHGNKAKYKTDQHQSIHLPLTHDNLPTDDNNICKIIKPTSKQVKSKSVLGTCPSQLTLVSTCKVAKRLPPSVDTDKLKPSSAKMLPMELLSPSEALRRRQTCYYSQRSSKVFPKCISKHSSQRLLMVSPTPTPTPTPSATSTVTDSLPSLCSWSLSSIEPPHQTVPRKSDWTQPRASEPYGDKKGET